MTTPTPSVRVFILDDHEVVRSGIRSLVETADDMAIVGESGTASGTIEKIEECRPDVAILDVRLPDGNGIEVCREVRSQLPEVRCLMLTSYEDDEALLASILAGASGYLLKEVGGSDLLADIRAVASGSSLLDPQAADRVARRLRRGPDADIRIAQLTPREMRILDLIAEGMTNREIAADLFLAEKTVKNYVSNVLSKLGMQRRTEAAVFAARRQARRDREVPGDL